MKKVLLGLGALALSLAVIPMFAAFEAHVINVTARIENALQVTTKHLDFGTVFPQEHLEQPLDVLLSRSFIEEDRVDDVEYFIRQKPKCGVTSHEGTVLDGPTWTGHVVPIKDDPATTGIDESKGGTAYMIDCEMDRPDGVTPHPEDPDFYLLPSLCEYISKDGRDEDGTETNNDEWLASFHKPWNVVGAQVVWNDTMGRLTKLAGDVLDRWIIDLAVPCFGGYCAQDWADFVHKYNQQADPNQYTQPIGNEHKVFGCNLWIEVKGVSETRE